MCRYSVYLPTSSHSLFSSSNAREKPQDKTKWGSYLSSEVWKTLSSISACTQWNQWWIDETSSCLTGNSMVDFLLEKAINLTTITISDKPTLHFSIWTSPILWNKKELVKRSPLKVVLLTSSSEWSPKMCYENNLLLNKNVYIITSILIEISFKFILLDIYFVKSFKLGIR